MKEKNIIKNEIKNLKTQDRKKKNKQYIDYNWIIKILLLSFGIAFLFSFLSEMIIPNVNIGLGLILLILFIGIGILFDMIGVSVQSAEEKVFHSMSARKVKGADIAVKFKKNADKVSSFCNDVIGDICGIISGSAASIIASSIAITFHISPFLMILGTTAFVSAITIGGKAIGKSIAINRSNYILYEFAKFVSNFYKIKK